PHEVVGEVGGVTVREPIPEPDEVAFNLPRSPPVEVTGLAAHDHERDFRRVRGADERQRIAQYVRVEGAGEAAIGRDDDDLSPRALALLEQRMPGTIRALRCAHEVAKELGHL